MTQRVRFLCIAVTLLLAVLCLGATTRTVVVDHGAQDPAISPDGSQIAVSILGKIWLVPARGGEATQLTNGVTWDDHPVWSPDGRFFAYAEQSAVGTELIVRNVATGTSVPLYQAPAPSTIEQIAYSPKLGEIFFIVRRGQYDAHIWRIQTNGDKPTQVTLADGWHETSFAFSSDGTQIFLDSGRYGGSNLYMLQLEKLEAKRLSHTQWSQYSVAWSRDGKMRAYIERENGIDYVVVTDAQGAARRIYSSPYNGKQLVFDHDSAFLILCSGRKLYRINATSGAAEPIPFTARFLLPEMAKPDLIITNARLIDGTGKPASAKTSIEVRDGRISAIRHDGTPSSAGVPVIDAAGKTVMPGLIDNHYHFWDPFEGQALLARGITSLRDVGTEISMTLNFREAQALGMIAGPKLYVTGPLIDGVNGYHPWVNVEINDPNAAPALVRSLKEQGVDALKVYFMLNPEVLAAVVKEAHAQGLPVTGHIGVRTGWNQAVDAGISGLSHIRVWRDFLPDDKQPNGDNESLDAGKSTIPRMQADWSSIDPDGPQVGALISKMAEKNVGFDPTLVIQTIEDPMRKRLGLEDFQIARESHDRMARFIVRAQKSGVMLLAGTDNAPLCDELEDYAKAGVPNQEILRAATLNGAKWLGRQAEFGTVEVGKRADLLMIDGDPLTDIKAVRNVIMVIQSGRVVYEK
jgi:imidazolonepropionase-like amidohydrolase